MKATGVVRKIDSLGRIVIPKEIRKNLKIKDGENLEIYIEDDTILLRKTSSLAGLQDFAKSFGEIVPSLLGKNLLITDMSEVIACNKEVSKNYLNQELSSDYLEILNKREVLVASIPSKISIVSSSCYYLLVPIVIHGDLLGSLFLFSETEEIQEKDQLLLKFILKFLDKNVEE